jgi:cation:H+ antiporter
VTLPAIVLYATVLAVGTAATWKGSGYLEGAAQELSTHYALPPLVQGSLVVAVGSSFPELVTTVGSTVVHGEFELGMSAVVGSAVFNILVIPGLAGLVGGPTEHDVRLVYRDALFYLTAVAVLLLAFSFAVIYDPLADAPLGGRLTRRTAVVPLALYGVYLFLQQQEIREGAPSGPGAGEEGAPSGPRAGAAGDSGEPAPTTDGDGGAAASPGRSWLVLAGGMLLVVVGVEGLLRTALWLGDALDTPSFVWGATVVAAATSVPDALVSVRSARAGRDDVSLGNVLGSNVFDLLVAIPLGVVVAGAVPVDFRVVAPLMAALTLATILLFTLVRTGLALTRREAWLLMTTYGVFVLWVVLESTGWPGWLP